MKKNLKYSSLLLFLFLFLFLGIESVFALELDYPKLPGVESPPFPGAPPEDILSLYVRYILALAIWAVGVIAFLALVYGAILYLTSTGKAEAITSAREQITSAFLGLLLLFSSFIILYFLNPQFIILEIPKPEPVEVIERPPVPSPPTKDFRSAMATELPFGTVIEKGIFEGTEPWEEEKRVPRIYNNSLRTKELVDDLREQSENLYNDSYKCTCRSTDPVPACGGTRWGNITWKCDCGGCSETEPCTCDPCAPVRGDIQNNEQKNLETIHLGAEITFTLKSEEEATVTTSLIEEQIKTEEEVRLIKEQLDELERIEKFMLDCQLSPLESLAEFLYTQDFYISKEWPFRNVKFWKEILIEEDWATFYCPISGTIYGGEIFPEIPPEVMEEEFPVVEPPESERQMACNTDIPVGEIIDRTKRTTYKLINRMEELIELDKKLIDAVDELQVLISQCSSQRGCERRCTCFGCLPQCIVCHHGHCHCRPGCEGWVYCCADSSPAYPGPCLERDEDSPCPYEEIDAQFEKINALHQRITEVIEGKENGDTPEERLENIGIIPIINEVIPAILEDLDLLVRKRMKECITDIPPEEEVTTEPQVMLSDCESAMGTIGPESVVITYCCLRQEEFQECLALCYLQVGDEEYKECLWGCLDEKADELEARGYPDTAAEIRHCFHIINFFCCGE